MSSSDADCKERTILFFTGNSTGNDFTSGIFVSSRYRVVRAESLPKLLQELDIHQFDLAVLTLAPDNETITDLSSTIRSICKVPVLFILTGNTDSTYMDKVKGCSDDFVFSPFNEEELLLRAELVMSCHSRRSKKMLDRFPIGGMEFDYKNQVLYTPSGMRMLTSTEAKLLHLLCLYKNNVLSREVALETIWGENDYFKSRSMDVYVARLRKILMDDTNITISNIYNTGFRLNVNEGGDGKR
ncbi:MAG: winged helix-turn-helix domain-containing protein [Bacteroidales bacterium]